LEDCEQSKTVTTLKTKISDRTTQQEWDEFDYVEGWCKEAGEDAGPLDWNPSVCKAIESEYWRGLNFGKPPMYGADLKGTLFTSATRHWNVGVLDNILTRLRLRRKLPGVTTPYLYFGMWRATFAWHVEDMDLYSINYIHFGAPKQWYAVRQSDRQRFELAMAGAFPGDSSRCRHFMRHKSYLASPAFLASAAGVKPFRLVQKAQEFVITYPYGYHSGFNLGFNCAESVNFALESWLDIGRKAGYCDCANDSVKMDVDAMLEESKEMIELDRKKEEKEKKKEAEEKILQSEEERLETRRARERERRRIKKEELARAPLRETVPEEGDLIAPAAKKARVQGVVCIFCPSTLEEDLVVVPYSDEELAKNSKRAIRLAHRICASFVPETWIGPNPRWSKDNDEPEEVVMGFEGIAKARWSLKCQTCVDPNMSKKGAKVQCTYGKCFRTSHVSCALQIGSGWMLDVLTDDDAADELEGKSKKAGGKGEGSLSHEAKEADDEGETRIVILCKSHNPREKEREARRRVEILHRCMTKIRIGQSIRVRTSSGLWETTLRAIKEAGSNKDGEGEIVVDDEQVIKSSKILFDQDVLKKAEEEQNEREEEIRREEEAAALKAEEVALSASALQEVKPAEKEREKEKEKKKTVVPLTEEEEARLRAKAEEAELRRKAKEADQEAKEAAKRQREEDRRLKEAAKMKRMEEKAAKAVEKEEKARAKELKRAEKEKKMATKRAKAASQGTKAPLSEHQPENSKTAAGSSPICPDYIRQWRPQERQTTSLPRPSLPLQANEPMQRQLAPLFPASSGGSTRSPHPALPSMQNGNSYPSHLATYQDRPQPLSSYHLAPFPAPGHQHEGMARQHSHAPPRMLSNLDYASHRLPPQSSRPAYPFHLQQQHAHPYAQAHAPPLYPQTYRVSDVAHSRPAPPSEHDVPDFDDSKDRKHSDAPPSQQQQIHAHHQHSSTFFDRSAVPPRYANHPPALYPQHPAHVGHHS
jgi:hypothetical protein